MHNDPLRSVEQILWWAALALIAAGLALAFMPPGPIPPGVVFGAGLIALGLNMLLGGDVIAGPEPRAFTARGQVVRGRLEVAAGLSDLSVDDGGSDRIAAIRFGPFGQPAFTAEGGMAHLGLKNPPLRPNIARWEARLADNVLWDIDARSSLGELRLDLSRLRLETVRARTILGRIHVACPQRGYARIDLKTAAGAIEVSVPPEVGATIRVRHGALGTVTVSNKRLLAPAPLHYVTPDYETAAAQVEIDVQAAAGEVILS